MEKIFWIAFAVSDNGGISNLHSGKKETRETAVAWAESHLGANNKSASVYIAQATLICTRDRQPVVTKSLTLDNTQFAPFPEGKPSC